MADLTIESIGKKKPSSIKGDVWLTCIECGEAYPPFDFVIYRCQKCRGLLEVRYANLPKFEDFSGRGVWRYSASLPFEKGVSIKEGDTPLYTVPRIETEIGIDTLRVKHEGMNPTGSFKDRGMTVGVRVVQELGVERLACASTGNTSASLAAYGSRAGLEVIVLLPAGKVAMGKVAQASLHGAKILQLDGNFDECLDIVTKLANEGEVYLLNSVNPFRLEGQKTIGFEILEQSLEEVGRYPDRIVLPVGNAGNTAALYKGFRELVASGALKVEEVPKITAIQAEGASPVVEAIKSGKGQVERWSDVETKATAIRIGNPVNAPKALPAIRETKGTAISVSDEEILAAQCELAEEGIGVEPASAASIAGLKKLRSQGVIEDGEYVVCLATGVLLKDPDAASFARDAPREIPASVEAVMQAILNS
tara:strand:- start:21527 stop:22792 length:1266 start_codon:yes stop_codon:yes gene_type:complete